MAVYCTGVLTANQAGNSPFRPSETSGLGPGKIRNRQDGSLGCQATEGRLRVEPRTAAIGADWPPLLRRTANAENWVEIPWASG